MVLQHWQARVHDHSLVSLFHCLTNFPVKRFFLISNLNFLWQLSGTPLHPGGWTSKRRDQHLTLCSPSQTAMMSLLNLPFSSWANLISSGALYNSCPLVLSPSLLACFGHTNIFMSFLYCFYCFYIIYLCLLYIITFTQYLRWGCGNAAYNSTITFFDWLALLRSMQPRVGLAFVTTRTHCWLILILPPKIPRFLSSGFHSSLVTWPVHTSTSQVQNPR